MKIRINDQICDMPLRCFEFSPIAKENTKYISNEEFNDIENDFLSQSAGAVQSVRGADTPPVGQKPHKAADRHC